MASKRKVYVREDDVLVLGEYEISAAVLRQMIKPEARVLWAFIVGENGDAVQPVPFSEENCIWLEAKDLERTPEELKDLLRG
jgi:hypothetical protein